ncbi:2-isopropylmalate synthase [Aquirhabdus sp.]|uniref:2-isopropylmalate synthase n=1 Tax=Aquirhabdus sp. TaxID=2824160 RepID=UPI00396CA278
MMLTDPSKKYRPAHQRVDLPDRTWPNNAISKAPIWMSTDLRDGNQALFEPMNAEQKLRMFKALVAIGFKEIEVAFPSASQTDFDFVRGLIENNLIPDDVTIEVLTQARDHLIERTMESVRGAKKVIVHVYNATSPVFRQTVFNLDQAETKALAVHAAQKIKGIAAQHPETQWTFQYSPETFTATELPFAKEVCDAITEVWEASSTNKVILNLPATVEVASPNVYADQIEWMHRNLARREGVILSLHPHNDRGCAVAAAELGVMAGADRVEGCLFGHGERTGNVDLVTLALNLYSQGISPNLDFSDINEVIRTVEECTRLPVHPRHPYAGDLVFTAFSGSHQDAIKKGFSMRQEGEFWEMPYLPLDPKDLGRNYDAVIRVNSQSGKGGIAYLLESNYGVVLPRRLQIELSQVVQVLTDESGSEVRAQDIWQLFHQQYVQVQQPYQYVSYKPEHIDENTEKVTLVVEEDGITQHWVGQGNGPISAVLNAFNHASLPQIEVVSYEERALGQGASAKAIAVIELVDKARNVSTFGVGIHDNITTASVQAIVACVNRLKAVEQNRQVA